MSKTKILIQLDTDAQPSTFDSVVAVDAGVEQLFSHGGVTLENVEGLVHGAMFTRGPKDLKYTALFFGGGDVEKTDAVVQRAMDCFFGSTRVSLLADPNGANTTATAAVLCAEQHLEIRGSTVTVLAGTGPVGIRIAEIIASLPGSDASKSATSKTTVRVCSRKLAKAEDVCEKLRASTGVDCFQACQTASASESAAAVEGADAIFAAGAAGIELLADGWLASSDPPKVAIDLNAVHPTGIAGIGPQDKAVVRDGTTCYGAIGVGGLKMKIHKRCVESLFESNDRVLQVNEIYRIGQQHFASTAGRSTSG